MSLELQNTCVEEATLLLKTTLFDKCENETVIDQINFIENLYIFI